MKNKKFIIGFTILIALMCAFFLSFTILSRKVQTDAEKYAYRVSGEKQNATLKQKYLDSVWNEPVFNFLGIDLTYREIKEKELNLGLDLKGGFFLVLEISPDELIEELAGNNTTPELKLALDRAEKNHNFLESFYHEYRKLSSAPLADLFVSIDSRDYISTESTDEETLSYLKREIEDAVNRTLEILRNRIDQYGVASPNIQRLPGTQRIQVELSGVDNPERVKNLLKGLAKLEFWEVWDLNDLEPVIQLIDRQWRSENKPLQAKETHEQAGSADSLADLLSHEDPALNEASPILQLLQPGRGLAYQLRDTAAVNRMLASESIARLLPGNIHFSWQAKPEKTPDGKMLLELFPLKSAYQNQPALTGSVISDARQSFENGSPAISMVMNRAGAQQWKKITGSNIGRQIAIVLDGRVYSAPVVQSEIPNGHSSITGNFTMEEAKDLANILKSGKMPAKIKIVEEAVVGPTLGAESIAKGMISLLAGLALVAFFMAAYYGKGGNIANFALLINIVFILGILAQFGASLTLPGIAGIVLTMGMSVDANVLIFERIREELGRGNPLALAVRMGYEKAYSSIIDSNVTTFLVGLILYLFGSGHIKGFAVVLMIGIVCSVFTAVFITQLFLERMARKEKLHPDSFNTFLSRNIVRAPNFDFLKYRKFAYLFSTLFIVIGITVSALTGSYQLGVDFKGGHSFVVKFDEPVKAEDVRHAIAGNFKESSLEVKTYNSPSQLRITTSYLVDSEVENADKLVKQSLENGLAELSELNPEVVGYSKVGASIANDIKASSRTAIIIAFIIIFLYILIRFHRWEYSLGATVALLHDVLMIFAFYGLAGVFGLHLEIDQAFIAAVLTIIGYSINDTVVIYDRIREFAGKALDKTQFAGIVNPAVNNTLSRTVITSFTVFIVTIILLFFSGEVLRGFSFALLVGVVFGTYSSIFIASPSAVDFMKEKRRIIGMIKSEKKAA